MLSLVINQKSSVASIENLATPIAGSKKDSNWNMKAVNHEQTCWLLNWDLGQLRNVNTMLFFSQVRVDTYALGPLLMISHLSPFITSNAPPTNDYFKKDKKKTVPTPITHVFMTRCGVHDVIQNCFKLNVKTDLIIHVYHKCLCYCNIDFSFFTFLPILKPDA